MQGTERWKDRVMKEGSVTEHGARSATATGESPGRTLAVLLVTDVVMPGMSGIELAERVFDRFPRTGVVLLSGYTAETLDVERIMARGGIFLSKPLASHELLAAVARAAKHRSAPGTGRA